MLACQELCFLISTFPEAHFQELYMPFPSHAHHKNWRYSCIHNNERINGHLCTHGQQKQRSRILSLMHWSMNVNPATCKRALQIISVACELCGIFCHVATLELVCNMATEAIKLAVCWKPSIHIGPLLYFLVQKCTNIRLFRCLFFSVVITLTCILLPISFFFHSHCATTSVALLKCPSASRQQIPCWQLYSFEWMQHSFKTLITTCLMLQKWAAVRCSNVVLPRLQHIWG